MWITSNTVSAMIEAAIIASSLSIDSFAAGFAYGSEKIKIPMLSVQIIGLISCAVMGVSLLVGSFSLSFIPPWVAKTLAFSILFFAGLLKLLDSITKSIIQKYSGIDKKFKLSMFNIKVILHLYANPQEADVDESKTISPAEASVLALSLSLDGMAVGFGAALAGVNSVFLVVWSLIANTAAIFFGCALGGSIAKKAKLDLSWIGGAALIAIAFSKLF